MWRLWRVAAVRPLNEAGTRRRDFAKPAELRRNPRPLGREDVKDVGELTRRVLLLSRLVSDGFGGSGGVWRCLLWPSRTPWHDGCTVTTELQKGSMFTTAAPMDAASVRCRICASSTCQNEWANCLSTYTCRRRLPAQLWIRCKLIWSALSESGRSSSWLSKTNRCTAHTHGPTLRAQTRWKNHGGILGAQAGRVFRAGTQHGNSPIEHESPCFFGARLDRGQNFWNRAKSAFSVPYAKLREKRPTADNSAFELRYRRRKSLAYLQKAVRLDLPSSKKWRMVGPGRRF